MKPLTCEMCGSTNLIKEDGVFVCQSCGTKYSVEEAKKMMVEGTVDVKGTVKVDTSDELKNLYEVARRAKDTDNSENALKYYDMILVKDPNSWEAQYYVVYYKAMCCRIAEISSAAISVANCYASVFRLIEDNVASEEEKANIIEEIYNRNVVIAYMLYNGAASHYKDTDYSIRADYSSEHIERGFYSSGVLQLFVSSLNDVFGDKYEEIKSKSLVSAIDIYASTLKDVFGYLKEGDLDLFMDDLDLIKKYHPDFELPEMRKNTTSTTSSSSSEGGCYVATCVYGSYDCPEVWTLRRFRDYTLAETWYGRLFIKTYYAISPKLVKWFGETRCFKRLFQQPLNNLVKKLQNEGVESTPYKDRNW